MLCEGPPGCGLEKLSEEFPPINPSSHCSHYIPYCLKCTIAFIETNERCPYDGCRESVSKTSKTIQLYYAIVESLFGDGECDEDNNDVKESRNGHFKYVTVVTTLRENTDIVIKYDDGFTVMNMKEQLYSKLGEETANRKLYYGQTELEEGYKLVAYNIPNGAKVTLDTGEDLWRFKDVTITTLQGESMNIKYDEHFTVSNLKERLYEEFGQEPVKQKLLFGDAELKEGDRSLVDYDVPNHSTIYLVVQLYGVTGAIHAAVFDLSWEYPKGFLSKHDIRIPGITNLIERKNVDASCFLLSGEFIEEIIDYKHTKSKFSRCVVHSKSILTDEKRKGHQIIDVKFQDIPEKITSVFFALSARDCSSISKFPNPSLQFYEQIRMTNVLCETTIPTDTKCRAIIMCYMTRSSSETNSWEIYKCGKVSEGNASDYSKLRGDVIEIIGHLTK